jgi:hypothetical protein
MGRSGSRIVLDTDSVYAHPDQSLFGLHDDTFIHFDNCNLG